MILVTNALQYLSHPMVDRIIVLEHGLVVECGSYKDLSKRKDSKFQTLLKAFTDTMSGEYSDGEQMQAEVFAGDESDHFKLPNAEVAPSERRRTSLRKSLVQDTDEKKSQKLTSDEMAEREIGKVGKEVYKTWTDAAGGLLVVPALILVFALGEATTILSNWWLTYWSHNADTSSSSQLHFLGVYGIINVSAIVGELLRQVAVILFGLQASRVVSCPRANVQNFLSCYLTFVVQFHSALHSLVGFYVECSDGVF